MCGIAGIYLKRQDLTTTRFPLERMADDLLLNIVTRGRHATGLVAANRTGTTVHCQKDNVPADFFVQYRDDLPEDTKMVLMHTRFATQGAAENNENNHPVIYKDTYVTHNGVVYNDDWLFKTELEEYPRVAEVDSIVFPTMIEEWGWEKIRDSLKLVTGSYAVACIQPKKNPDELIIARGDSSPVHYYETNQALVWASEAWHLQDAWERAYGTAPKTMHSLHEGEMLVVKQDNIVRERYMERPRYTSYNSYPSRSRQERFAWMNDENTTEHRGTPNQDCLECGERLGVHAIWGEYETDTHECKWRVWICMECFKDKKCADDLQWKHVLEPIESWSTPKAAKPKNIGTISGASEHVDEFLNLQPGQVIPEYLVDEAFKDADCEVCGTWETYALDDSGMPICQECYVAATDTSEVTLVKCDQCEAWVADVTLTMLGSLCNNCVDKKDFASHAHPSFDVCDGCNRVKKSSEMTYGENSLPRCSSCTPTFDLDVAFGRFLERYRASGEDLFETDGSLKLVAEEYRLPAGLLTFICYRDTIENDPQLEWARHTLLTAVSLAVKAFHTRIEVESA